MYNNNSIYIDDWHVVQCCEIAEHHLLGFELPNIRDLKSKNIIVRVYVYACEYECVCVCMHVCFNS